MRPSAPVFPLDDIEFHWNDEVLVVYLIRMLNGAPFPANVITDVNPYDFLPWNLPDNMWYFFNLAGPNATENGYWRATGEDYRITTDSNTTGWRTTLEFYRGQAPHGTKTGWMMYQYRVNQKGPSEKNNIQDSSSLCRVFLDSIQSPNREEHRNCARANNHNAQAPTSRSLVLRGIDDNGPFAVSGRNLPDQRPENPVHDLHETYISRGDYLELLDLVNPESLSSSSANSSCLTMSSEECFDSEAFLRDLQAGNNQDMQKNYKNCNLSVSTSLRPSQMVLKATTIGSTIEQQDLDSKASKHVLGLHKVGGVDQGLARNSKKGVASSSKGLPAASNGERKAVGWMTKLRKKCCCCLF